MSKADRAARQEARYEKFKDNHERQLREAQAKQAEARGKAAAKLQNAKDRMDKLGERGVIRRTRKRG